MGQSISRTKQLQWGLTYSGKETGRTNVHCAVWALRLQWGLTYSGKETPQWRTGQVPGAPLQWGLTYSGKETVYYENVADFNDAASMGPYLFR